MLPRLAARTGFAFRAATRFTGLPVLIRADLDLVLRARTEAARFVFSFFFAGSAFLGLGVGLGFDVAFAFTFGGTCFFSLATGRAAVVFAPGSLRRS